LSTVEDSIQLLPGPVVHWREQAALTHQAIDDQFLHFADLTRELKAFGWIWDVEVLHPPPPEALTRFCHRAATFAARTTHLALRTGSNIGLWLPLRHVLPRAGFGSISVHRNLATAVERARHG